MTQETHARASALILPLKLAAAITLSILTGITAQIAVPIEPLGIPVTLHTLVVVLAAVGLGAAYGTLSMLIYITAGILGVPLFADHSAGPAVILGQTGGYIVGFALCQPVVHLIVRDARNDVRPWPFVLLAALAAHAVVFAAGVPWVYITHAVLDNNPGFTFQQAIDGGLTPFIPGTIIKSALATLIAWYITPWINRDSCSL